MSEPSGRENQLQVVPVFALRNLLLELVTDDETEEAMRAHIEAILGIRSRQSAGTINRLTREDLVQLIVPHPQIDTEEIDELVGEYRYGRNPSFYIYLFDPSTFHGTVAAGRFRQQLQEHLDQYNQAKALLSQPPLVKEIHLNDLTPLPEKPEMMEASYRFLKRLEYVDVDENLVVTYETLYGFFWLNRVQGYWAVYQRLARVTGQLRQALAQAAGIRLTPLAISKKFRDELSFLFQSDLRSGRLYDPDPESDNYRFMSVTDDKPYRKGYAELEERYPQIRSARYRVSVGERKRTTLSIRYDRGALSLAGIFKGSEFRTWALARLDEIVDVLSAFEAIPRQFVATRDLLRVPALQRLKVRQREHVQAIIVCLLSLKQTGADYASLDVSALDVALDLVRLLHVQVPLPLEQEEFQIFLACPRCERPEFLVGEQGEQIFLRCRDGHDPTLYMPLSGETEEGVEWDLTVSELAERIELRPSQKLLQILGRVINRHLAPFRFHPEQEDFLIRGRHLFYHARPPDPEERAPVQRNTVTIHVGGNVEEGATLIGVYDQSRKGDGA